MVAASTTDEVLAPSLLLIFNSIVIESSGVEFNYLDFLLLESGSSNGKFKFTNSNYVTCFELQLILHLPEQLPNPF